ncbi:hypothetical protein AAVH_32405, partial [Aphelenchoides avenae]
MSTSALLLPLELPMLVLHTGVFVVVIKLANHGDRYKTFYVLYALQNLAELLAFLTVSYSLRFPLMGIVQTSALGETFGQFIIKAAYFGLYYFRAAHWTVALERSLAILTPKFHKQFRSTVGLSLLVGFAVLTSLASVSLNVMDVSIVLHAGDMIRVLPRSIAVHL